MIEPFIINMCSLIIDFNFFIELGFDYIYIYIYIEREREREREREETKRPKQFQGGKKGKPKNIN